MIGDLKYVVDRISILLTNERHDYLIAFEEDKGRLPLDLRDDLFSGLIKFVSIHALQITESPGCRP